MRSRTAAASTAPDAPVLPNLWEDRPFEFDLEDLAAAGVVFTPEQERILWTGLCGYADMTCMTVGFVREPLERYHLENPMLTYEPKRDLFGIVPYPQVCHVSELFMEGLIDDQYSTGDWRYPSVAGRTRRMDSWWEEADLYPPESVRLWNLWPLDPMLVDDLESSVSMWLEDTLAPLIDIAGLDSGEISECDWASGVGLGEVEEHEHTDWEGNPIQPDADRPSDRCKTGEQGLREFYLSLTVEHPDRKSRYGEPVSFWLPPEGPKLPTPLRDTWTQLMESSRTNTFRAHRALPPWQRDDVLRTERHYSPWLWSL